MDWTNRIAAHYDQGNEGPLLIAIGGLHGNELAGVHSIDLMQKMLEVEPITNPNFKYKGTFYGLLGNLNALNRGIRFHAMDLNRLWTEEIVDMVMSEEHENISEFEELKELWHCMNQLIQEYNGENVVIIDIHTTTADGGIFTIPYPSSTSLRIAKAIHAPVVLGLEKNLIGTMASYYGKYANKLFKDKNVYPIAFEGGTHGDPLSVNRSIAAIINCMKFIGCVEEKDIEYAHDKVLTDYSEGLPKVSEVLYCHKISPEDHFVMRSGFRNFQEIEKGVLLAHDLKGEIYAPYGGRILMPLYQKMGEDGFFIVKDVEKSIMN